MIANPPLSVTNTGSVQPGTTLTFKSAAINGTVSEDVSRQFCRTCTVLLSPPTGSRNCSAKCLRVVCLSPFHCRSNSARCLQASMGLLQSLSLRTLSHWQPVLFNRPAIQWLPDRRWLLLILSPTCSARRYVQSQAVPQALALAPPPVTSPHQPVQAQPRLLQTLRGRQAQVQRRHPRPIRLLAHLQMAK